MREEDGDGGDGALEMCQKSMRLGMVAAESQSFLGLLC